MELRMEVSVKKSNTKTGKDKCSEKKEREKTEGKKWGNERKEDKTRKRRKYIAKENNWAYPFDAH